MTTPTRIERELPAILTDLSAGPTPEYLDDVLGLTGRIRQRPGWTFPERWLPMADITRARVFAPAPPWRLIALALALIALVAAAALLSVGAQRRVPPPFGPAGNGLIPFVHSGNIYLGDPVAGTTKLLVGDSGADAAPGFSPDGTRLTFIRDVGTSASGESLPVDLYVANSDGTARTRITSSPIVKLVAAAWTADSRQLAVVHPIDDVNRLDMVDASARRPPTRIGAADGIDSIEFRPPLGHEILYRALVNGRYGLFTMDAGGGNVRTLVPPTNPAGVDQDLNSAVYSADGARIFYQRWFPDSIQLWVMNADGTDQHRFVHDPLAGWDGEARPSPDGQWVAFWHVLDGRATQRVSVVRAGRYGSHHPNRTRDDGHRRLVVVARFVDDPDDAVGRFQPVTIPAGSAGRGMDDRRLAIRRRSRLATGRAVMAA